MGATLAFLLTAIALRVEHGLTPEEGVLFAQFLRDAAAKHLAIDARQ